MKSIRTWYPENGSLQRRQGLDLTVVSTSDVTDTTATLNWTAVAGATGYLVGRDGSDSHGGGTFQTTVSSSTLSQSMVWLIPGTTYTLFCQPLPGGVKQTVTITTETTTPPPTSGTPVDDAGSLAIGAASYTVPAGAVFMATNGNDSTGDGTQAKPYATLTKAVSSVAAGGTIVIRAGSYNEGEDTQDQAYPYGVGIAKNVTIQNYPNEAVWFDGSVVVTGSWTKSGSTWSTPYSQIFDRSPTFTHGQADGAGADTGAGGWFLADDTPQASWPDMVLYDGVQLTQVTSLAQVTSGTFFVDGHNGNDAYWFVGTTLYIGDNPAGHEIRYANKTKLATLSGKTNASTLRGIGIRRYASFSSGFGLLYVQHNLTMENCWIEDTSCNVLSFDSCTGTTLTKVTGRRIGGNNFCTSNETRSLTFDRMDLQQVNYAGWNVYGPTNGAIKLAKTQNVILKNSIISNNNASGFWTDQTVATPIIVNCLFENNTNRGVDLETSSDGVVANCKFVHNGTVSIFINDSDTTRMYNNTFADNSWNVTATEGGHGGGTSTACPLIQLGQSPRRYDVSQYSYCIDPQLPSSYYTGTASHQWTINSFELVNNVMAHAGVNTYSMMIAGNNGDTTRDPNRKFQPDFHPVMNGNVYHWGSNKPPYPWATAGGYQQNFGIYQTLAAFQSATSLDTNSTYYSADPLNSDLTLKDASVHTKATGLPSDIAAWIGQPAGTKHVGCFW